MQLCFFRCFENRCCSLLTKNWWMVKRRRQDKLWWENEVSIESQISLFHIFQSLMKPLSWGASSDVNSMKYWIRASLASCQALGRLSQINWHKTSKTSDCAKLTSIYVKNTTKMVKTLHYVFFKAEIRETCARRARIKSGCMESLNDSGPFGLINIHYRLWQKS